MIKVCIVAGARPNFMKIAPIIRAISKAKDEGKNIDYRLIYTGSQEDPTIEHSLFNDLQIPAPNDYLRVDSTNLNELTGKTMLAFEKELDKHPADIVIVVDDLASTMAVAIVTKKKGIALANLVAGTRSFDINMPKEINRLVIDGLSDLLFTAGVSSNRNVSREGAEDSQIYMVGNILIDTLRFNHSQMRKPKLFDELGLKDNKYIIFTINRHALLSKKKNLDAMLKAISANAGKMPVIAPVRGYVYERLADMLSDKGNIQITQSLPYLDFGYLTSHAKGIITDSGNIAEEATFNGVPCITLNSYTEHIETVNEGTNVLVGGDAEKLGETVKQLVKGKWKQGSLPERWDGRTAERIVQILLEYKY